MTLILPTFPQRSFAAFRSCHLLSLGMLLLLAGVAAPAFAQTATTTTLTISTATTQTGVGYTTLTAKVLAGASAPSRGRVMFCDSAAGTAAACVFSKQMSTVQTIQSGGSAGTAIYRLSPRAGTHNFYAVYVANTLYASSVSAVQQSTVTGTTSTVTTVAQSGSTGNYSLTATVTGTSGTVPAGTVDFLDESAGFNQLGSASLGAGSATTALAVGANPNVSGQPDAVASLDYNGDGILDLAIASQTTNGVSILQGMGAGQFKVLLNSDVGGNNSGVYYAATGSGPSAMVTADFNGDGVPDLLVANGDGSYTVMLGATGGTFTPTTTSISSMLSGSPSQIAVGDFNGDGYADVAIPSPNSGSVVILLGNGHGTFTASSVSLSDAPYAVAVSDFNNDGKQDLVVGGAFGTTFFLRGNGDGTFTQSQSISGPGATSIVVGDFNDDGNADVATTNTNGDYSITVLKGAGNGTFTQVQNISTNFLNAYFLTGADFNGDGLTDLALVGRGTAQNATHASNVAGTLMAVGDGTFQQPTLIYAGVTQTYNPLSLTTAAFNDNGVPYVVATFQGNDDVSTIYTATTTSVSTATATNINPVGTGTHNVGAFYLGQGVNAGSSSSTTALTGSGLLTNTITFPQPSSPVAVGGTATLSATSTSGAVLYTITAGTATLSGSSITYTTAGTVQITASSPASGNYAAATPVTVTVTVTQPTASVLWLPSTLSVYTGTPLSGGILDASDSVPATIGYSAYLLASGAASATTVSNGTMLSQGAYGLVATITPTSTSYASQALTLPFTVQNMNVFVAAQSSVLSFFNNGNTQTAATSGGGLGAAVDSSGNVWSIDATGASVSKFSDAGALLATYTVGTGASALAVDGLGHVWITNSNGTVSELNNDGTVANASVAAAAGLSSPASVSVDSAGSLWIANPGNNTVTETFGEAAPASPISASVYNNTPGTRP